MGKNSRIKAREIAEMQAMSMDLQGLQFAKYLCQGFNCTAVTIQTNLGPAAGVTLQFVMKDESEHEPIILDPIGMINLIAAVSGVLSGRAVPAPQPPGTGEGESGEGEQPTSESTTSSGLILPS